MAMAGFALLLLALSLWRRKQIGWVLTVTILAISIPTHLIKGLDYEEAVLAAMGFTLAYGVLGFFLLDRHFQVNFGLWEAVR